MSHGPAQGERCWCGSGKQRRKRHPVAKERKDVLTVTFDRPVTPAKLEMTPGGVVRFYDERGNVMTPQTQTLQRQFDRSKGPKSVFRVSQGGNVPLAASLETSLSNFSRLYVVDTNTKVSGTSSLSVSVIARTEYRPYSDELTVALQEIVAAFELHNVRGSNPEVVA